MTTIEAMKLLSLIICGYGITMGAIAIIGLIMEVIRIWRR